MAISNSITADTPHTDTGDIQFVNPPDTSRPPAAPKVQALLLKEFTEVLIRLSIFLFVYENNIGNQLLLPIS